MSNFGTIDLSQSLRFQNPNISASDYGLDRLAEQIQTELNAHNEAYSPLINTFCDVIDVAWGTYGGRQGITMEDGGEYGIHDPQRPFEPYNMGFEVRRAAVSLQWTLDYLEDTSVKEIAQIYKYVEMADLRKLQERTQRALFNNTNRTFKDTLVTNQNLPVFAFFNADGNEIPDSPSGARSFDGSTHTHYNAANVAFDNSDANIARLSALLTNVTEHGLTDVENLYLYVNDTAVPVLTSMVGSFFPVTDRRVQMGSGAQYMIGEYLDFNNPEDRIIGTFNGAKVVVKPWVPVNYFVAMDVGVAGQKPLVYRTKPNGKGKDLRMIQRHSHEPLTLEGFRRDYGISVKNRHMGAILQFGSASYVNPFAV